MEHEAKRELQKQLFSRLKQIDDDQLDRRATSEADVLLLRDLIDLCKSLKESTKPFSIVKDPPDEILHDDSTEALRQSIAYLDGLESRLKSKEPKDRGLTETDRNNVKRFIQMVSDSLARESFMGRASPVIARFEVGKLEDRLHLMIKRATEAMEAELKRFETGNLERTKAELVATFRKQIEEIAQASSQLRNDLKSVEQSRAKLEESSSRSLRTLEERFEQRLEKLRGSVGELAAGDEHVRTLIAKQFAAIDEKVKKLDDDLAKSDASLTTAVEDISAKLGALSDNMLREAASYVDRHVNPALVEVDDKLKAADLKMKEMQSLHDLFSRLRAPAMVAKYAQRFRDDAAQARSHAGVFMCFGVFTVVVAVGLAFLFHCFFYPPKYSGAGEYVHYTTSKVFLFGLLATVGSSLFPMETAGTV